MSKCNVMRGMLSVLALVVSLGTECYATQAATPQVIIPMEQATAAPQHSDGAVVDKLSAIFAQDWWPEPTNQDLASEGTNADEIPSETPLIFKEESQSDTSKSAVKDLSKNKPKIAILIDDLGYSRQGMDAALELPKNVALAILPMTPFASQTAKKAHHQKRIIILHAPMENERELKLGPGGLYAKMSKEQLKAALNKDIDSLPGIKGINNHMGSLLTSNQNSMDWVMEVLQKRSLFFIDSLTSPHSVAKKTALHYGLKTGSRDVFLDNIRVNKAIDHQFSRLITIAKRSGIALAIGHPYPETMAYLKKRLRELSKDGIELVPLTDVLHQQVQTASN